MSHLWNRKYYKNTYWYSKLDIRASKVPSKGLSIKQGIFNHLDTFLWKRGVVEWIKPKIKIYRGSSNPLEGVFSLHCVRWFFWLIVGSDFRLSCLVGRVWAKEKVRGREREEGEGNKNKKPIKNRISVSLLLEFSVESTRFDENNLNIPGLHFYAQSITEGFHCKLKAAREWMRQGKGSRNAKYFRRTISAHGRERQATSTATDIENSIFDYSFWCIVSQKWDKRLGSANQTKYIHWRVKSMIKLCCAKKGKFPADLPSYIFCNRFLEMASIGE